MVSQPLALSGFFAVNTFTIPFSGHIDPRISGLIWSVMLASLAAVITVPGTNVIRVYAFSSILRMIYSVGLQPTLWMLGTVNVSIITSLLPMKTKCYALF